MHHGPPTVIMARMNVSLGRGGEAKLIANKLEKASRQLTYNLNKTIHNRHLREYRESSSHRFTRRKWNNFLAYESASTAIVKRPI